MDNKSENIKSQMRKGFLEYCILLYLKQKPAYVYKIVNVLRDANFVVVEGTLYPLLTRLKNSGILTYSWEESRMGPPRKYYKLTPEGEKFLDELESAYSEIINIVEFIKQRSNEQNDID